MRTRYRLVAAMSAAVDPPYQVRFGGWADGLLSAAGQETLLAALAEALTLIGSAGQIFEVAVHADDDVIGVSMTSSVPENADGDLEALQAMAERIGARFAAAASAAQSRRAEPGRHHRVRTFGPIADGRPSLT
jgi:hypothetical protein